MLANIQNSVIINKGKDLKISKKKCLTGMADRRVLVQMKKIYLPPGYRENLVRGAWMSDFTCPTFRKFETFGQVGCRTCNTDPYKWLYRRL